MQNPVKEPENQKSKHSLEDRIIALSDGIFAVAMTLLVIDIKLPENIKNGAELNAALNELIPRILLYAITFIVVGIYWFTQRRILRNIRRVDAIFTWLNLIFLALISFFPVTSNFLGQYGDYPQVVIIYTLVLAGCGLTSFCMWLYASWKHRLIDEDFDPKLINHQAVQILIDPLFYLLSLGLLLFPVPTTTVFYSWFLLAFIHIIVARMYRRRMLPFLVSPTSE